MERVFQETFGEERLPLRRVRSPPPELPVIGRYPAREGQPVEEAHAYAQAHPNASFRPPQNNPEAAAWNAAMPPESRPTQVDYDEIDSDLFEAPPRPV